MLILLSSALAGPTQVQITYTATFDLDATGDQICPLTGFCDCASTYLGTGMLQTEEGDRMTFYGTWKASQNTCGKELTIWVPADGKAFHTLRHGGGSLSEWVVHADASKHQRLLSGMKTSGQFWMNEIDLSWPGTTFAVKQSDGTTLAGGIKLQASHDLQITLGK